MRIDRFDSIAPNAHHQHVILQANDVSTIIYGIVRLHDACRWQISLHVLCFGRRLSQALW